MDWKKLNFDEIGYYCRSTKAETDFQCYPLRFQIHILLSILYYYEVYDFQINDIQTLYSILQLRKMKSDGILAPQPKKIQTILERLEAERKVSITADGYHITDINRELSGFYKEKLKEGYELDYISGWIAYDRKNSLLKTENIPL